jgi:hypothetical protein
MMKRAILFAALGAFVASPVDVADAKPKKAKAQKKKPKAKAKGKAKGKAEAKAATKIDEPAPTPDPAPAPEPVVVAPAPAPAPAPVPINATPSKARIAVIGDATLAAQVAKSLEGRFEIVPAQSDEPKYVAAKHTLHAVIVVSAGATSTAIAYQGSDGAELARVEIKGGKFVAAKKIGPEAADKLSPKIASASGPSIEAVAAMSMGNTSSLERGIVGRVVSRPRPRRDLVIAVEERPFWRRLRYNDDFDDRLRPSDLVANAVGLSAAYRPLKNFQPFSVVGRGELAVGVNGSRTSDGTAYATSSSEWGLGAGLDVGIRSARIGIVVTYGEQRFSVDDDPAMELLPDVTYRFARAGASFAMPLARRFSLLVTGGYRHLLGMGGMTDATWFPRATGAGIDVAAGVALHVTSWLDLHARLDTRRYFFAMNPEVGDPWIAGGATDDYIGGAIGLAISPR